MESIDKLVQEFNSLGKSRDGVLETIKKQLHSNFASYSQGVHDLINNDPIKAYSTFSDCFKQTPEGVWVPKSYMPDDVSDADDITPVLITDEKEFNEIIKYGKSFLKNPDEIFEGIAYNKKEKVVGNTRPKFAICVDMYKKEINDKIRIITAGQLEPHREFYHNKFWVNDGFNLTGTRDININDAKFLYAQYQKRGIGNLQNSGFLEVPIRMDLRGLELNEDGNILLTDESIYTEAKNLIGKNYKFKTKDKFGVPIKDADGTRTCYVPTKSGLFRCVSSRGLDSYARYELLGGSGPVGRVVLAKPRSG